MVCDDCGVRVRPGQPGSWRFVSGWVQERSGGGAHAISDARSLGPVVCEMCMKSRKLGGQESLL